MNAVAIEAMLDKGLEKLHAFRKKRERPQLDDKIILSERPDDHSAGKGRWSIG